MTTTRKEHIQKLILSKLDHLIDEELAIMGDHYSDSEISQEVLLTTAKGE